jgi:hypothetical protein
MLEPGSGQAQRDLPFDDRPRHVVCDQPARFVGMKGREEVYHCDGCGVPFSVLRPCKKSNRSVDSRKPHKCETAEAPTSTVSVILPTCVASGSVGRNTPLGEGASHG